MLNHVINYAMKNIWCSPEQDYQSIVKLARISPDIGAIDRVQVAWERYPLPTKTHYYHVFQIGHIHPKLMGLFVQCNTWTRLTDLINTTSLMAEIYTNGGVLLPRVDCWVHYDRHRNLIVAIRQHARFPDLKTATPYLRVYSNAYFNSDRVDASMDRTEVDGRFVVSVDDVLALQNKHHQTRALPGAVTVYCNGKLRDDLRPIDVAVGDYIEYQYDSTVYRVIDFPVSGLPMFESLLDTKRKYLLNSTEDVATIDYEDDIDFFLIKKTSNGRFEGVLYHRNRQDAVRMVTHKDYSVPVDAVQNYRLAHSEVWSDINELTIRLYVRKAGFERPLGFEANRIFELYRLSPNNIFKAMLGIDSTVPEWRAEHLENAAYVKLMGDPTGNLDPTLVQKALGYNAISRLVGDTPQRVEVGGAVPKAALPVGLQVESTVYEYDGEGLLLGWYTHDVGADYWCVHAETRAIEVMAGEGSEQLDATFGQEVVNTDPRYNYRAYLCTLLGTTPAWDWVDVSNTEIIVPHDNQIRFNVNPVSDYPAVISDKRFLAYQFTMEDKNGVFKFTVSSLETHDAVTDRYIKSIPPRRVDVWLNRHPLIEGLDYHVKWPEITVVNKTYLTSDAEQTLVVRAVGFAHPDLSMDAHREHGFVEHGYLSHDRRYDVRDDKVLSVVVGGKLTLRDELSFAEDNLGVSLPGIANGTPYAIREVIVPLRGETYLDTYALREDAMVIDAKVADYLSLKYPQPEIPGISGIPERYVVYTPFLSRLLHDLVEGILPTEPLTGHYSDADVRQWVASYTYLLDFDPAYLGVDDRYVAIHPHRFDRVVDISIYHFNFLKRVNRLFFDDKVLFNHFFKVLLPQAGEELPEGGTPTQPEPGNPTPGLPADYTPIYTPQQLFDMRNNPDGKYALMNDLDLTGWNWANGVTRNLTTQGILDGRGHVIRNFVAESTATEAGGLFSRCAGTVRRLGFENIQITGDDVNYSSALGDPKTGALIEDVYVQGTIDKSDRAGGLFGWTDTTQPGPTVQRCYSAVTSVHSNSKIGSMVGFVYRMVGLNNHYDADLYFRGVGGASAQTTVEMGIADTYTNWDFLSVWTMGENGYPMLRPVS